MNGMIWNWGWLGVGRLFGKTLSRIEAWKSPILYLPFIPIGITGRELVFLLLPLAYHTFLLTFSPQKTSPVICPSSSSSLCSSSASSACSSTTSTDFPPNSIISEQFNSTQQQHFNFPPQHQFSSSFNCQNCLLEKQRLIEKERELVETRTELERIRSRKFNKKTGIS